MEDQCLLGIVGVRRNGRGLRFGQHAPPIMIDMIFENALHHEDMTNLPALLVCSVRTFRCSIYIINDRGNFIIFISAFEITNLRQKCAFIVQLSAHWAAVQPPRR